MRPACRATMARRRSRLCRPSRLCRRAARAPKPGAGGGTGLKDDAAFFAAVRNAFGPLRGDDQVPGMKAILAACGGGKWGAAFTANALATAWLETNQTMQPVAEAYYLKGKVKDLDAWRKRKLRHYPHYGRGYVQLHLGL